MKIDLDQAMAMAEVQEKSLPFDLVITVGGKEARVRPLSVADVAEVARVQHMRQIEEVRKLVQGLLVDPIEIADGQLMPAILAISIGYGEHLKKKSATLEKAIRASTTRDDSGS